MIVITLSQVKHNLQMFMTLRESSVLWAFRLANFIFHLTLTY